MVVIHDVRGVAGVVAGVTAATASATATARKHVAKHHAGDQIACAVALMNNRRLLLNHNRRGRSGDNLRAGRLSNRCACCSSLFCCCRGARLLLQGRNLLRLRGNNLIFFVCAIAARKRGKANGQRRDEEDFFHVGFPLLPEPGGRLFAGSGSLRVFGANACQLVVCLVQCGQERVYP